MKRGSAPAKTVSKSRVIQFSGTRAEAGIKGSRQISRDAITALFLNVGQRLRDGLSSEAESLLRNAIEDHDHSANDLANLKRLLAFTLETLGQYRDSLAILKPYEDEEHLKHLDIETQVRVTTQLAIGYNNLNDHPKAVTLLKDNHERAKANELPHLLGSIDTGLARVYRKLNECAICRDHAESALENYRNHGDWLGMAEAYREIAISYHQEGRSEKSLEYFELAIQIIGDRSAPFMLGKIYTDMSGAYWFLRRPQDGIECLEKSIEFFDRTEHILNSVIAYNNLGINLMLTGDWVRAETMIKRALDLAIKTNHVHIAGILDSLGELKILRGDLDEALDLLERAIKLAKERKREWYELQAMRNLARCILAKGNFEKAAEVSRNAIDLSARIGDKHYANMAGLVLAESLMHLRRFGECENRLQIIEESDPTSDFFVLGNIQRIRGLAAAEEGDQEMAVHHFNRSLTIFEAAGDLYHTGLSNYLIGTNLGIEQSARVIKHLTKAHEIFKKIGLDQLATSIKSHISRLKTASDTEIEPKKPRRTNSVVSQLLMVRLAEATASRELLFRELIAVLQQESSAKKLIIAQSNPRNKKLDPFITHGYSPEESGQMIRKFEAAREKGDDKNFLRAKGISVLHLRPANAEHAFLFIYPQSGASLSDGNSIQPLLRVVELGMDVIALREKDTTAPIEQDASPFTSNSLMPGFIHSSPAMTALVEEVYKIRSSDVTVLVTGESGTGKELVSRAIHTMSNRKDKVFVPFNCTAVPKELAEGHLFGYRKGAFTGATADSPGIIRAADGGTLFLDEIGDLPLDVQPKLLRFLQEGEVQPIGEKRPIKVDVRVIAATNMPLEEKVADGTFREDLFYRLNVIRLRVPPLRERRSEIPPMVNYYINHYSARFGKRDISFTPQTTDLLMVCDWEGNVRQLCNEIQRIVARAVDGEVVTPNHLSPELKRAAKPMAAYTDSEKVVPIASYDAPFMPFANISQGGTLEEAVSELEMQMIKSSLARNSWNISRVASELGLTRRGLYLKLSRYGIEKAA
ncbi:MAG: sigma 54-interacting transcriptional regulator [Pyrinomonadaceae bacterium]|nr:sigma 54-interacting transcriptional regulator [Blastocatellia bacterium]MCW5957054.1 sigma 54-interacting transcriptional regulator [Pyrinomonadaceae bacterium]